MQNDLFQVFVCYPGEGTVRKGSLKTRPHAIKYAAKQPAHLKAEVRTIQGRVVWMRTSTGAPVDLEAPDAFAILEGLTPPKAPKPLIAPKPFTPRPGSLASQCKAPATPKARPTWAQLEASAIQAEAEAQSRALRWEHFSR